MSSNAAFKESSKIQLLQQGIGEVGWHFQLGQPILENFLSHIDHPYKGLPFVLFHGLDQCLFP
jgi:proteasome activator subunit 4